MGDSTAAAIAHPGRGGRAKRRLCPLKIAGRGQRIAWGDRSVGLDVDDGPIEIGAHFDTHRLNAHRNTANGREDGVDRNHTNGGSGRDGL